MGEELEVQILEESWAIEFFDCREDSINEFLKTRTMEFKKAQDVLKKLLTKL